MVLVWSRHCLGFRRKGEIYRPSAHTKPDVLNLLRPRFLDSTASGVICRHSVQTYKSSYRFTGKSNSSPRPFYQVFPSSGLSMLRTGTRCCAGNLSSELWCLAVSADNLLQTFCCLTPCICFLEPISHLETGPATPTREWVHGRIPRTSWRLQMLTILLAPLFPPSVSAA